MDVSQIKQEIHEFIEQADERFIRLVYSMVESEKYEDIFFNRSNDELVKRAKKSLSSIEKGDTRNIYEFKKDIEAWKEKKTIQ